MIFHFIDFPFYPRYNLVCRIRKHIDRYFPIQFTHAALLTVNDMQSKSFQNHWWTETNNKPIQNYGNINYIEACVCVDVSHVRRVYNEL